jgi:hypothetical protein
MNTHLYFNGLNFIRTVEKPKKEKVSSVRLKGTLLSRPAGHISVGSEPRRGRMKGQETRRRQQDKGSDQAAKFYCSHRGIYVLRE